jgi:hypothetical protein
LQELKGIKPDKAWASSVKKQVFKEDVIMNIWESITPGFVFRTLSYASLCVMVMSFGVVLAAQYTLPGNPLFAVKKITEYSKIAFFSGVDDSQYSIDIANKRLSDLSAIVSTRQKQNIPQGISEFKQSVSDMADNLDANDRPALQQIATRVEVLGAMINNPQDGSQLNGALAPVVLKEISDMENSSLTSDQQSQLDKVKEMYDKGEFSLALENLLLITK